MTTEAHRIPVIIGVADVIQKQVPRLEEALEPLALLDAAVRAAVTDSGAAPMLAEIDSVRVVGQVSWPYRSLAGALAARLGATGAHPVDGPVGGESPVRLLVDAAVDIACGRSQLAVVAGAEALRSRAMYAAAGLTPPWSDPDPQARLPQAEDFVSPLAALYGLLLPLDVYPLYENALRARWQQPFAEAQLESGVIWSEMSKVAARNPAAWSGKVRSAEAVITPAEDNRPVSFPYQKFMVANLMVNQAGAVLVTSLARARALGIAEDRMVYVWGGAGANEPADFLTRDRFDEAPAMEAVLEHALSRHSLSVRDVQLFELYSCFPCVPKMARRALGLSEHAALSVAGGLTFFGGPGNNYMTHAVTAMVRAMRQGEGEHGLLYGNGEFVTKHHAAVLSRRAPPADVPVGNDDLQGAVDAACRPGPRLRTDYEGECSIETFQLRFDAAGRPDRGTVVARTPAGERVIARVTEAEPDMLDSLASGEQEPVGRRGVVYAATDGWSHFGWSAPATQPPLPVSYEVRDEHIAIITLRRPEQRNAINGAVARLIAQYVDRVEADPQIRVAVLTAEGGPAFCAGADLQESRKGRGMDLVVGRKGFAGFVNAQRRKPWIAAIAGFALGGGTEIALACELVVAGQSAQFGLPEVSRSLVAGAGGLWRLPRSVPPRVAMEMILTGKAITAERALTLHLVNQVVPDAEVLDSALQLAAAIVRHAPLAVQASLSVARRYLEDEGALNAASMEAIGRLMVSEDFREGLTAFVEKRPPKWLGR